jgi:hypothetical protein
VSADAVPTAADDPEVLDIYRSSIRATVLKPSDGREQLLFAEGGRQIHVDVRQGTLLNGPVRLDFVLPGLLHLDMRTLTLRRLAVLSSAGRIPSELFPRPRKADRWVMILETLDAMARGASQREIAVAIFGSPAVESDWTDCSDYMRLRVQRLVRAARFLSDGGYLDLLRGSRGRVSPMRFKGRSMPRPVRPIGPTR